MGLWQWIVGAVTEQGEGAPPTAGGQSASTGRVASAGQATAVAELPCENEHDQLDSFTENPACWWQKDGATLTEPPPVKKPIFEAEAHALENLLVSHFDGHDLSMPPLLHIAQRVTNILRKKKTGFGEVAEAISDDQVMAAAVLRMANSPLYRGLHKITTLQNSITRLGAKALRTLMVHQSLRAITFDAGGDMAEFAAMLWARSLASGCIMRKIGPLVGMDEEDAFLTGLLHDIGNVILLRIMLDNDAVAQYELDTPTFEYLCYESHQEFGELIAAEWKLPTQLTSLISSHHAYPEDDDPHRSPRLLLQVTDMITSMLGYAQEHPFDLMNTRAVKDLGWTDKPAFTRVLQELPEMIEESVATL